MTCLPYTNVYYKRKEREERQKENVNEKKRNQKRITKMDIWKSYTV